MLPAVISRIWGSPSSSRAIDGADHVSRLWLSWALALIVAGARLGIFDYAGGPLPYFDQWLMEFNNLFLMGLNGHSAWDILFTRHNEHLMMTTRVLSLTGFWLNGYWDVKFLVVMAAMVRAGEAVLAFRLLADGRKPMIRAVVWAVCVIVFAAPISAFNLLCGMQVSFFLGDIAVLWAMWAVLRWRNARQGIWQLGLSGAFGLLSMGSAIAIPAATLAIHLLQRRPRPGFWLAWSASMVLVAGYGWLVVMETPRSRPLSWVQVPFFFQLLSWPVLNAALGAGLAACALVWVWRTIRLAGCDDNGILAGAGLAVFAAVNTAMLALNRLPGEFHPRHWDMVSLGTLGVIAMAAGLGERAVRFRRLAAWGAGGLVALYVCGFAFRMGTESLPYLEDAHIRRSVVLDRYRELFLSGEIRLTGERINARLMEKDYRFFDDPMDRFAPHPIVVLNIIGRPLPTLSLLSPEIFPVRERSLTGDVVGGVIRFGWLLLPAGVVAGMWGFWRGRERA